MYLYLFIPLGQKAPPAYKIEEGCSVETRQQTEHDDSDEETSRDQEGSFFCNRCNTKVKGSSSEHEDFHFAMRFAILCVPVVIE